MRKLLRFQKLPAVLLLLIFISTAFADEKSDAADKLFAQWARPDTPGCALAVIRDGKIIYKKGYGSADLEHSIPISPDSVFYIGSVSKQFVAMSVAMLAKEGRLSLDDEVRRFIPELADYGIPLTIRHLIHHTSGLRDYLALLDIAGFDFGTFHEEDVIELIARQKELNFKPGAEYLYSNSGYFLLGIIVKRVSGKTLREFTEEKIFKPLGMKNSHFHDDYTQLIRNRAYGYFPAGEGKYRNFISTFDCVGSGGLYTSAEDLFLWDQNFYQGTVGGKDLIELMQTPGTLNNGQKLEYAFALTVSTYKGLKTVGHGGALGGYRSYIIRFPDKKFSVICLSNLSAFNPGKPSLQIADIYLGGEFKEKSGAETSAAEKAKFAEIPAVKLKEKVGCYIHPETGGVIRLFFNEQNQRLISRVHDQNLPLEALSETEFQVLEAPLKSIIKFENQGKGKPLLMHVFQEGEKPETYESFEMWAPTQDRLQEYEGDYSSQELQVTFSLALREGKLHFVHKNAPKPPLQPITKDRFSVTGLTIRFIRGEKNKISGFTLNAGRVRNLRFTKK